LHPPPPNPGSLPYTTLFRSLLGHAGPEAGGGCRGNGNPPLLLLFHPVHGRGTVMYFTHFMGLACVKQDAFCGGGFTRVHMRTNTNITITFDGRCTCHGAGLGLIKSDSERKPCSLLPCGVRLHAS